MDFELLEQRIQYTFKDRALLRKAMTHKSFSHTNNERLEFLGDTVLNSIIGIKLFKEYPTFNEGKLSQLRALLVNGEALGKLARGIDLGDFIRLGKGEQKSGGRNRTSTLEDAFEALIGAIFLDSDWQTVEQVVAVLFDDLIASINTKKYKNYKSELQEIMQSQKKPLPDYELEHISGVEHDQVFHVVCRIVDDQLETRASASSRKKAEQAAAKKMLKLLD